MFKSFIRQPNITGNIHIINFINTYTCKYLSNINIQGASDIPDEYLCTMHSCVLDSIIN